MKLIIFIVSIYLVACTSFSKLQQMHTDSALDAKSESDKRELEAVQEILEQQKYNEAKDAFVAFQKKHPHSYYYQSARLGEAESLIGLNQGDRAVEIYQSVQEQTHHLQPEISALAMYKISYAYEAVSEEEKAISSLMSAEKHADFLPDQVIKAEIPARLAILYNKIGKNDVAEKYLQKANIGVRALESGPGVKPDKSWFARMYYQMGQISTQQLSPDNLRAYVKSQLAVQKYLLRAIDLQDKQWSERATMTLINSYQSFWHLTKNMPLSSGIDSEVARRTQRENQIEAATLIVEMSKQAKLWRPYSGTSQSAWQQKLYSYLAKLDEKTNAMLYSSVEATVLTEESKKINGLKRDGIIVEKVENTEKKLVPDANTPRSDQDPNL